jgi:hypothetical protein
MTNECEYRRIDPCTIVRQHNEINNLHCLTGTKGPIEMIEEKTRLTNRTSEERAMNCPKCSTECYRDEVDVGVGINRTISSRDRKQYIDPSPRMVIVGTQ